MTLNAARHCQSYQPATGHLLLSIIVSANHCCQLKRRDMRLRPTCGDWICSHLFSLFCYCFTSQYFIFLPWEIFSSDRAPLQFYTSTKKRTIEETNTYNRWTSMYSAFTSFLRCPQQHMRMQPLGHYFWTFANFTGTRTKNVCNT